MGSAGMETVGEPRETWGGRAFNQRAIMTPQKLKQIRHSLPAKAGDVRPGRPANGGNGWTQNDFARQLGISPRTYEGYERAGAQIPQPIAKLAQLLSATIGNNEK